MTPSRSAQTASAAIGLLVIPAMSIAFAISFAAIIFKGPLTPLLGQGITLALMGATVMGAIGSLFFSFRGAICAPQDVTSILLAGAAAAIVASFPLLGVQDLLSTIIVLLMVSSIFAGIAAFAFGKLRLGYLARFMPYPVVGGFLAAVGYLLWTSALGMMLDEEVTIYTIWHVVGQSDPLRWVQWMLAALGITLLLRRGSGVFTLPFTLLASIVFFYLALEFGNVSPQDAAPLLLGPFEDMNLRALVQDGFAAPVQWGAIIT
jgi:SulP family sulfate permease